MQNMIFKRKLPIPKEIKEQYPLTAELSQVKARRDKEIADVFTGKSSKMVLIIGPCSADREDAVLEYCERLAKLQEPVSDKLVLIPRVYTNKPRTTGDGYKGLLHQPDPRKPPICWRASLPSAACTPMCWQAPAFPPPTKCSTPTITAIFPICCPMWRWARGVSKIRSTV